MNTIAETILKQLGGNKFIVMTGAKDLYSMSNALQFKLPKAGKNKANIVRITLETDDTYMIEYFYMHALECKDRGIERGIYADNLQHAFTVATGFDTHL